ncbi:WD repeat-containing protein 74 [Impatiens glandulifera]|uniref:WD repeat-containing protein 74 n=1 Tax=Impatiens glandulifera TaxID=253017 RepID=UPI001FB0C112|nr:WD repeat-containing protein 74 [Impatiens glandulifera]
MPRTTTIECPGCPPIRTLTFDSLGLIKVVEARNKEGGGVPKVVEKWGEPDSSKCVLAASINDRKFNPLLAVARKNGLVEVLSPLTGDPFFSIPNDGSPEDDAVVGLHLFKKKTESSKRSCTLLRCTTNGHANISTYKIPKSAKKTVSCTSTASWDVCASGSILCSKVDPTENYALFGGKRVEVNLWDLDKQDKVWASKPPPKDSLGIFTPTWFTSATFISNDDHRKFAAGTNNSQVHIYDISAQRRPVLTYKFRETPIKALTEDLDGNTIYLGNGSGDLASIDTRTGKLLGCFLGKCSGSIRSIARHPELPVIASCGLDSYVRFWDVNSRQLISAVFLKQHLNSVVFDSNFTLEDITQTKTDEVLLNDEQGNVDDMDEESPVVVKRKKSSKEHKPSKEHKSKKKSKLEEA